MLSHLRTEDSAPRQIPCYPCFVASPMLPANSRWPSITFQLLQTQPTSTEVRNTEFSLTQALSNIQPESASRPESPSLRDVLSVLRKQRQELVVQVSDLHSELDNVKLTTSNTEQERHKREQNLDKLQTSWRKVLNERDTEYEVLHTAHLERIRLLEQQLDNAQTETSQANRERLQLQQDFATLSAELRAVTTAGGETERKLRKEVKRLESLLTEKEFILEHLLEQSPTDHNHTRIKKLRDRVDEADETNETLSRQRRTLQVELDDAQYQLSISNRIKKELEEQLSTAKRQLIDVTAQLEEQKEAVKEAQRLHQSAIVARSVDATAIETQAQEIGELLTERDVLRNELDELRLKLSSSEMDQVSRTNMDRLELKIRELEQRLEVETLSKNRLQLSLQRARNTIEQLTTERDRLAESEDKGKQLNRKLTRQLREAQQVQAEMTQRAQNAKRRAEEAMKQANLAIRQATISHFDVNTTTAQRISEWEAWTGRLLLSSDEEEDEHPYPMGDGCYRKCHAGTQPFGYELNVDSTVKQNGHSLSLTQQPPSITLSSTIKNRPSESFFE